MYFFIKLCHTLCIDKFIRFLLGKLIAVIVSRNNTEIIIHCEYNVILTIIFFFCVRDTLLIAIFFLNNSTARWLSSSLANWSTIEIYRLHCCSSLELFILRKVGGFEMSLMSRANKRNVHFLFVCTPIATPTSSSGGLPAEFYWRTRNFLPYTYILFSSFTFFLHYNIFLQCICIYSVCVCINFFTSLCVSVRCSLFPLSHYLIVNYGNHKILWGGIVSPELAAATASGDRRSSLILCIYYYYHQKQRGYTKIALYDNNIIIIIHHLIN